MKIKQLYAILIAAKTLASAPDQDPQASKGYCYVYISNGALVAGATYDSNGNLMSSGPLAAVTTPAHSAVIFGSFLENTKTTNGLFQALVGVSFGSSLPASPVLNINLSDGRKSDIIFGGSGM